MNTEAETYLEPAKRLARECPVPPARLDRPCPRYYIRIHPYPSVVEKYCFR